MVALDKQDNIAKYRTYWDKVKTTGLQWQTQPTNTKKQTNQVLRTIKAEGGIGDNIYKRLYPASVGLPRLYGLPNIHKKAPP